MPEWLKMCTKFSFDLSAKAFRFLSLIVDLMQILYIITNVPCCYVKLEWDFFHAVQRPTFGPLVRHDHDDAVVRGGLEQRNYYQPI